MTGKEKSARTIQRIEHLLRCPHCGKEMKIMDYKSIICENNHTFDLAKQGYVNLTTRQVKTQYDKNLFLARNHIITESNLYEKLRKKINTIMKENIDRKDGTTVLDAGCGEGSHLEVILDLYHDPSTIGVGLDLAKEGVRMAASHNKQAVWLVADLAEVPFMDHSFQTILNILSPANYNEFKRLLAPGGVVIKVVPRAGYLKEIREAFYQQTSKEEYTNENTVTLFKEHFQLIEHYQLTYSKTLSPNELKDLVQMTPLTWNLSEANLATFIDGNPKEITIDLDILVGK